jgi:hypothetical protein
VGKIRFIQRNTKKLAIPRPKHKYIILDNGSHPYQVYDYGSRADIYAFKFDRESNEEVFTPLDI